MIILLFIYLFPEVAPALRKPACAAAGPALGSATRRSVSYTCVYISLSLYTYIYIYRERERYVYIYIYIHTHVCVCIYIYIYIYTYVTCEYVHVIHLSLYTSNILYTSLRGSGLARIRISKPGGT